VHWEGGVYFGNYPGAQFPVGEFGNQPVGRLCHARWTPEIRVIDIALILPPAARESAARCSVKLSTKREQPALR